MASDAEKQASERVSGKNCDQAMVSADGTYLYPMHEGIPRLIPQAAIDLSATKSTLATEGEDANLRRSAR